MADLAHDLIGDIRLGRGGRGRIVQGRGFGKSGSSGKGGRSGESVFSAQARTLWQLGQGSNSAVLKKITRGGTHTAHSLNAQFDYLFSKSEAVFGNMAELEPGERKLSAEQRKDMALDWADGWGGKVNNGHTTHLLLSFPTDLSARKALHIAQEWAFEMFQSGTHANDEWNYVAALHTDRPNPHVHIIVNNRGLENDEWFFMAREHDFNLAMMKERLVGIAAEINVELDASSRLERGILTYAASRAEIEGAKRLGQPLHERMRHGVALEDGLEIVSQSAATLRSLASLASLVSLEDIAAKMGRAADILNNGGILTPKTLEIDMPQSDTAQARKDIDLSFSSWLEKTEQQISTLNVDDRREMRKDLSEMTTQIMRDLGDERGAELVNRSPRSELYKTQVLDGEISRGTISKDLSESKSLEVKSHVFIAAEAIGIDKEAMSRRLEQPAANAWQEREWIKQDLQAVSKAQNLDLGRENERHQAAGLVDRFYEAAAKTLNAALEVENVHSNDRVTRTLETLAMTHKVSGRVEFEHEDHADRFATDLKERYGEKVMEQIAAGNDKALAVDFPEAGQRREIARALVAAAVSHESIGLTTRQAEMAKERLHERETPQHELRRKDHDLEL